jgi:hypothetical protein
VEQFPSRHSNAVTGILSGFDRLVFRGMLRKLAHRGGMLSNLYAMRVLLNNFASHAAALTGWLTDASEALARPAERPIQPSSKLVDPLGEWQLHVGGQHLGFHAEPSGQPELATARRFDNPVSAAR